MLYIVTFRILQTHAHLILTCTRYIDKILIHTQSRYRQVADVNLRWRIGTY